MTTEKRKSPKNAPAGESEGESSSEVTPLPEDDTTASEEPESTSQEAEDDDPPAAPKKTKKAAPPVVSKPEGFLAGVKRFWWDEEL